MWTLIAAVIAAAGGIITGAMMNKETEDAQIEARTLSERARNDTLSLNAENQKLNEENLKLNKQQMKFDRDAELYDRKERAVERGMVARENNFQKSLSLVNNNEIAKTNFLNNWRRA